MSGCSGGGCGCGGPSGEGGACGLSVKHGVPAVVRLVLGGLFILAGYMKLTNGDFSYHSVKAFDFGLSVPVLQVLAWVVPWAELLTGLLLVLGLWARGAAVVVMLMMGAFMAGIASVMWRGMDVKCGCFGALKLFCGDQPMGWCHLIRNAVMGGAGLLVLVMGPGVPSLDRCLGSWRARKSSTGHNA